MHSELALWLHQLVGLLLQPVMAALLVVVALAIWDTGILLGERFGGLLRWRGAGLAAVERMARRRIDRADLITRMGPMLGLMGTLIPLGPGLAALGRGELEGLTGAMIVAFDTTVLGLLAGILGFLCGRWRRRHYNHLLEELEAASDAPATAQPV